MGLSSVVNEIDSQELAARLLSDAPPELLDVRSAMEVYQGMLPGADHVPMEQIPSQISSYPTDKELIIYCRSGVRSYHACNYLMQNGYPNVVNLRGGILDWVRSGNEVVPFQGAD